MVSIGAYLRRERELRQVSLEELVQSTRIPLRTLQYIEEDRFDELPGEVFVRGFLKSVATALGLNPLDVLRRYEAERAVPEPEPIQMSSVAPADRGRRFGIAIALVILVILFTLALSIVLRPRHREAPLELSMGPVPAGLDLVSAPSGAAERA